MNELHSRKSPEITTEVCRAKRSDRSLSEERKSHHVLLWKNRLEMVQLASRESKLQVSQDGATIACSTCDIVSKISSQRPPRMDASHRLSRPFRLPIPGKHSTSKLQRHITTAIVLNENAGIAITDQHGTSARTLQSPTRPAWTSNFYHRSFSPTLETRRKSRNK